MLTEALRLGLGGVLIAGAVSKMAAPASSRAALATFGIRSARAQWVVWAAVVAAELGLAAGVIAGIDAAALLAAALMIILAAALTHAMLNGRAGAPCACFGARSTVSWRAAARDVGLAALLVTVVFLPEPSLSTDEWLELGLGLALLSCLGLTIAVLALAREVGLLRLRIGPSSALEIIDEGPELGERIELIDRFEIRDRAALALAVFSSAGCHVCRALEPAIRSLAQDPELGVLVFDEVDDAAAWRALEIPGSPFAIVLDRAGVVLAKGTFNNLAQLESVVATAARRRNELTGAVAVNG